MHLNRRQGLVLLAATAALMAGCDSAESARIDETRNRLVGSWVREGGPAGEGKLQRVLVLAADGKFTERIEFSPPAGPVQRKEFAGEWSYDGQNLKRRFLREDGRQFSGGGMRFATFPLVSVDARELVLDDTVNKTQATYRRAAGGSPA